MGAHVYHAGVYGYPYAGLYGYGLPVVAPLKKRLKDARSVRLTPRLTLRPMLLLMPGMDTTVVPAIMVDTTAVGTMEAGEDITDTLTDMDTDTDGANRQKQITS